MKKVLYFLLMICLLNSCAAEPPIQEEAPLAELVFESEDETPDIKGGGYPRFETLADGTLLLFSSNYVYKSNDNASSFTPIYTLKNAAKTAQSASGKVHPLSCENLQGFTLSDGRVMLSYRARTKDYKSGEFYTSIRVMMSDDNATTFDNEVIIAEATTDSFHGYWEPFIIQPDENTLLLFYSDDLNVPFSSSQQNIVYHEYNVTENTWSESKIAINGAKRNSRDGMPVITELLGGGYAMVIETQDYHNRFCGLTFGKSVFVISISLSKDGKTWSDPVPVIAPEDIGGGDRCAAPFITTLPDGRVVISYMTEDGFVGNRVGDAVLNCVYGAAISDKPITHDTEIQITKGGTAEGFSTLPDVFDEGNNGYMIWNTVFCDGKYVYFAGSAGANDGSVIASVRIRRAYIPE